MTCVLCARREPAVGHLCAPCYDKTADTLLQIQRETEHLSAVPSMAQAHGTRGGTLASHRAPARLDVLVLTDHRTAADEHGTLGILGVLHSWARGIRDDRGLAWPQRITVASERRTLSAHLEWAAAQPWIDEMAAEIRGLLNQLRRANGTQPDPPAGRCYLPTDSGATCDGPIWVDDAAGHAHCGWCRATWDGELLARLKWELDRAHAEHEREKRRPHTHDGRPMHTAQELARDHGVTVNAIRLRLSRARARAIDGHYDPAALGEKIDA